MKVQFEFSAADLADVARRSNNRSRVLRGWRLQARFTWAALLSLAMFFAIDAQVVARAVYSIMFCIAIVVIYPWIWGSSPDRRVMAYYREQLGGDGPFTCELEITTDGVTTKQGGAETRRTWSGVKEIVDTPGGVEFLWRSGGLLVVRDGAFQSPQRRSEFIETARAFLTSNSQSSEMS